MEKMPGRLEWTVKITKRGLQKVMPDNVSISKLETERNINLFLSYYSNSIIKELLQDIPDDEYFYACNHRQMYRVMEYAGIREKYFSIIADRVSILENIEKHGAEYSLHGIPYSLDNGNFVFAIPKSSLLNSNSASLIEKLSLREDEVLGMKLFNEPAFIYTNGRNIEEVAINLAKQKIILQIGNVFLGKHLLNLYRKYLSAKEIQDVETDPKRITMITISYLDNEMKIPKEFFYKIEGKEQWFYASLICFEASSIGLGSCPCVKEHDTYYAVPVTASDVLEIVEGIDANNELKNKLMEYLENDIDKKLDLLKSLAFYFSSTSIEDFLDDFLACKKFGFNPEEKVKEALKSIVGEKKEIPVSVRITTDIDEIALTSDEKSGITFFIDEDMENIAVAVMGSLYVLKDETLVQVEEKTKDRGMEL